MQLWYLYQVVIRFAFLVFLLVYVAWVTASNTYEHTFVSAATPSPDSMINNQYDLRYNLGCAAVSLYVLALFVECCSFINEHRYIRSINYSLVVLTQGFFLFQVALIIWDMVHANTNGPQRCASPLLCCDEAVRTNPDYTCPDKDTIACDPTVSANDLSINSRCWVDLIYILLLILIYPIISVFAYSKAHLAWVSLSSSSSSSEESVKEK